MSVLPVPRSDNGPAPYADAPPGGGHRAPTRPSVHNGAGATARIVGVAAAAAFRDPAPVPSGAARRDASAPASLERFAPAPPPPLASARLATATLDAPTDLADAGRRAAVDLDADFTALMLAIQQVSDTQIQDMLASIDDTARMNRGLIRSQLAAAERRAAAIAEQESAAAASFWLGLLGDVLLLIASALLTIVTGGAGAFLMAMAVANVALTAWDIVARIHQQRTGQDISLAAGLAAFAQEVCGADEQTAQQAGQWTSLVVKLVVAVGSIAGTVRSAAQAAGHVRTFTTTMHVAGTAAQLGEAGTGVYRHHHANEARHAHLDESSIRALSIVLKERLERALQALELQFGQRQEFTRGTRRNLELMHESRHIPFSRYA